MTQLEAYTELEQTIGACFGSADREFAVHPTDEQAAKEKRKLIKEHELEREKVQVIVEKFMYHEGVHTSVLKEQVDKAMKFFFKG